MGGVNLELLLIKKDGEWPKDIALGDSIDISLDESGSSYIIGRISGADLVVMAPSVGRKVVGLRLEPDGIWIEGYNSVGSALEINGVLMRRPYCLLPDKAILWVGKVGFQVKLTDTP